MPSHSRALFQYFSLANRVLTTPELAGVTGLIKRLPSPAERNLFTCPAALYRMRVKSLLSAVEDHLLLFAGELEEQDIPHIVEVLRNIESKSQLALVTPGGKTAPSQELPDRVTHWSSAELFDKFLSIPSDFYAQLRTESSIDRVNDFPVVYQSRQARVLSLPGQGPRESNVNVDEYLLEWLQEHQRTSPIFLLGERGSGKSWQVLRFAQDAYGKHKEDPWRFGPVFFVKLRELVNLIEEASAATPALCSYVFQKYRCIASQFDSNAMLAALFGTGQTAVCVDGLDEMDLLPTDEAVRSRFTSLLMLLSKRTRFVLTCRPGHFRSLSALLELPAWSGTQVADTFEVLELLPFDRASELSYVNEAIVKRYNRPVTVAEFIERPSGPLEAALSICGRHPALLAHIAEMISKGVEEPSVLIGSAIRNVVVAFNVLRARTREEYQIAPEHWIDLSIERREELLSDLAWYMAERYMEAIDLNALPLRIRLTYEITNDALQRDIRSQTAFELVNRDGEKKDQPDRTGVSGEQASSSSGNGTADGQEPAHLTSLVRFTLRNERVEPGSSDSSVTGAYFLARYIADRLSEPAPFREATVEVKIRFLGKVRLGPMTCSLLKSMLAEHSIVPRDLGRSAWQLITGLARSHGSRVFTPWFRHLAHNLRELGALTDEEALALDPWDNLVSSIIRSPCRLQPRYEMVLVPPPDDASGAAPFLLGLHEVTNEQYLSFLMATPSEPDRDSTVQGPEWRVSRMTLAGAGRSHRSPNFVLSNEYHLFFWLPSNPSTRQTAEGREDYLDTVYRPRPETFRHPVSYVSWFASAAFCDWLSIGEGIARNYQADLFRALDEPLPKSTEEAGVEPGSGYRLPTAAEWFWAARAGQPDVRWPWELFPYYVAPETRRLPVMDEEAHERYKKAQEVMRQILLDTGKQQYEVTFDEPNDLGVSSLIGNVREWCDDAAETAETGERGPSQRLVLGATGYLGRHTFDFERKYRAPLYPRNTNPDVGFRLARSLTAGEKRTLEIRQQQLASQPDELSSSGPL